MTNLIKKLPSKIKENKLKAGIFLGLSAFNLFSNLSAMLFNMINDKFN